MTKQLIFCEKSCNDGRAHGLEQIEADEIEKYASNISGYSIHSPLGKHLGGTIEYLTTSPGFGKIKNILDSYDNLEGIADEEAVFKPCAHLGCDVIKPVYYLAKSSDSKENLPAFAFYLFDRDLFALEYNFQITLDKEIFLDFKNRIERRLYPLEVKPINPFLGFDAARDIKETADSFLELYGLCKEGVNKKITLCSGHLPHSKPLEKDIMQEIDDYIHKKNPNMIKGINYEISRGSFKKTEKYNVNQINSGNAPRGYNVIS